MCFNEKPSYDGLRLRLICSNDRTKDWVEAIFPTLDLGEGANFKLVIIGPPPKLFKANIVMPAKTYNPATLFSIITAQNPFLDTKFCKYASRTKVDDNKNRTWLIGVDENTVQPLKDIGCRPFVGLGQIKISLTNQPL